MNSIGKSFIILTGVIGIAGCGSSNDIEAMQTEPTSYLLIESEVEDTRAPLNYVIVPEADTVSVLQKFEDDYEAFDIEDFAVTEDTVTFSYAEQTVELTDVRDQRFEDSKGNRYEMSYLSDDEDE